MSKPNELISQKRLVNLEAIEHHRKLVKNKSLKALGESATNTALKTSITAIRLFSYLTVIFAIPVHFLASLYYKSVGRKVINEDNIALIRNKCLFIPTAKESDFLQKSKLLRRGEYLNETQETFNAISEAHQVYDFARAYSCSKTSSSLESYLKQSQISKKDIIAIRQLADKISNNKYTYQKIPSWFKSISSINKTLNIVASSEEDRGAVYELLHLITNCGKDLIKLDSKKADQFSMIANVYREIRNQGSEPEKAKPATLLLLPLVIHLYNQNREDVAKAFTDSFIDHSYLRNEIDENPDEFIIQFNKHVKNCLEELNTPEAVEKAMIDFQNEFNHPEQLDEDLVNHFGEGNAALVKDMLKRVDPRVVAGAKAFKQSKLAEQPFTEQIRLLIPDIMEDVGLSKAVVTKVLITDDLSAETFVDKKNLLKKLKPLFEKTGNLDLIQECFVLLDDGFLENIDNSDYWSDWNKAMAYAKRKFLDNGTSCKAVAKAYSSVVRSLTKKNEGSHLLAIEHLGHACDSYAFINRDRREAIRNEIGTELALYTLQEKLKLVSADEVAQTVANHYGLELIIIKAYLHSPVEEDFVDQLRTLKTLSDKLPSLNKSLKNTQLVNTFIKTYGPDLFTCFLADSNQSTKLAKVLAFGNELSKKGIYSSKVVAKALEQTLSTLTNEKSMSSEEALEALYQAAKSIIDNDKDEEVKCLLQEKLLHIETVKRAKAYATSNDHTVSADTKKLIRQLLESFVVHKELPKKTTVDYITGAINHTLELHFNEEATDIAIALSFASCSQLKSELSELDKLGRPTLSESTLEIIKENAIARDRMEDTISIDQEKLLFPLLIELLPGLCKSFIPEERKDLHRELESKLGRIRQRFDRSKTFKLELEEAYKHVGLVYTWLNLGPTMLSPFISTALNLVIKELQKAQEGLRQLNSDRVDSEVIAEMLATGESTTAMKTFLPLAAEAMTGLHTKHNEILEIKSRDIEPLIVTEGSDEEQRIDDYTNVVVLKPFEAVLMDLFEKIPDSQSNLVKLIDKAPHLLQASGGLGSWFTRKIGSKLIKKQLNENLGMNEHHIKFLKDNIEDLLGIAVTLAPYIMKRHNIKDYLSKVHALKSMTISEEPLDQKELHLALLELLETIVTDLKEYKPTIIESIGHIHKNISK